MLFFPHFPTINAQSLIRLTPVISLWEKLLNCLSFPAADIITSGMWISSQTVAIINLVNGGCINDKALSIGELDYFAVELL